MKLYDYSYKNKSFRIKESIENGLLFIAWTLIALASFLVVLSFCNMVTPDINSLMHKISIMLLAVSAVLLVLYLLIHFIIKN